MSMFRYYSKKFNQIKFVSNANNSRRELTMIVFKTCSLYKKRVLAWLLTLLFFGPEKIN